MSEHDSSSTGSPNPERSENDDALPALPRTRPARPEQPHPFDAEFKQMESKRFFQIVDATLKHPARVVHELVHGTGSQVPAALLFLLLICLLGTGLMMGSFSGGAQLWAVPLKVMLGTLACGVICAPSLYIMLCLCGGSQNFIQTCRMLIMGLALSGILLIGFIPVAWIFSQATEATIFMGVLYLFIWSIALFFGLRLMCNTFQFLNRKSMGALRLWIFIFALVILQMSTTLRPLLGSYEPLKFDEKKFFIEYWVNQ